MPEDVKEDRLSPIGDRAGPVAALVAERFVAVLEQVEFQFRRHHRLEAKGFGKWGFAQDPHDIARLMIAHIDKKRKALGLDKGRERVLMDMQDRRAIDAA